MDYEPFEVSYTAGQPYVGATLTMMPAGADVMTGKADGSTNLRSIHCVALKPVKLFGLTKNNSLYGQVQLQQLAASYSTALWKAT
jgi:hypothetical protein